MMRRADGQVVLKGLDARTAQVSWSQSARGNVALGMRQILTGNSMAATREVLEGIRTNYGSRTGRAFGLLLAPLFDFGAGIVLGVKNIVDGAFNLTGHSFPHRAPPVEPPRPADDGEPHLSNKAYWNQRYDHEQLREQVRELRNADTKV